MEGNERKISNEVLFKQILVKALREPMFTENFLSKAPIDTTYEDAHEVIGGENYNFYEMLHFIITQRHRTSRDVIRKSELSSLVEDYCLKRKYDNDVMQRAFQFTEDIYNTHKEQELEDSSGYNSVDELIETHLKMKMRLDIMVEYGQLSNYKDDEKMQEFSDRFEEVGRLRVGVGKGTLFLKRDFEQIVELMDSFQYSVIPTGFAQLDAINSGGLGRGELGIILALSGTGKTMVMINLAINYLKQGYNVKFFALEELENRMMLRTLQTLFHQNRSDIIPNNIANKELLERIGITLAEQEGLGELVFSQYPPQTATVSMLEQDIHDANRELEKPIDVIITDYPDLIKNTQATNNQSVDDGFMYEEMRRIGQQFNAISWTASQMNRTAYSAEVRGIEHIEGGARKRNASELVMAVNQTPEEYDEGYMRLFIDKCRNSSQKERMVLLKVEGMTHVVRDPTDNEFLYHTQNLVGDDKEGYMKGNDSQYKKKASDKASKAEESNADKNQFFQTQPIINP